MSNKVKFNGYFDNAATSFPKPENVGKEILRYLYEIGGPYGRSFYGKALDVSRFVEETRFLASEKFGADADNLVFTSNATYGINTVLKGMANLENKEVLISPLEHNAVMRPLRELENSKKITIKTLSSDSDGFINIQNIKKSLSPKTGLVVINHQSNVNGVIQPISEIKKAIGNIPILIDAAQSAGHVEINIDEDNLDFVAFTGHKGLLGPTGTGGIFLKHPDMIKQIVEGGTGSKSESFETPMFLPDKFEAGTPNIVGLFGLGGALNSNLEIKHTKNDFINFITEVKQVEGYRVYCANSENRQGDLFSISADFCDSSTLAMHLYQKHNIETRVGLHCSPLAHKFLGTYPTGTVRIAPSKYYHSVEDFNQVIDALVRIRGNPPATEE